MAVTITSVRGIGRDPPTHIRAEGTVSNCEDLNCRCGDTVTVTASCQPGAGMASQVTVGPLALPCQECPDLTIDGVNPPTVSMNCVAGTRTVTFTYHVAQAAGQNAVLQWDFGDGTPTVAFVVTGPTPPGGAQTQHDYQAPASGISTFIATLSVVFPADCTCAGSLPPKLVKNRRYGPGIPLIHGMPEPPDGHQRGKPRSSYPRISSGVLGSRTRRRAQCRAMSSSSPARRRPVRSRCRRARRSRRARRGVSPRRAQAGAIRWMPAAEFPVPVAEVPRVTAPTADEVPELAGLVTDLKVLADTAAGDLAPRLGPLVAAYREWIRRQTARIDNPASGLGEVPRALELHDRRWHP